MTGNRRALVVRVGALGDVLLTRQLTYSLSLDGIRSTLFSPIRHAHLLSRDPWIEDVIDSESLDARDVFAGRWPFPKAAFDVAIVISASPEVLDASSQAAKKTIAITPTSTNDNLSIADQWANAASVIAPARTGTMPSLPAGPDPNATARATLIHPGSGSPRKNWPIERFVDLSEALRESGHRVLWIRGPAEADFPTAAGEIEWMKTLSLEALASTLASARLFIGNDSGVAHLAAAVGAPTIALFGPSNDRVWRPRGRHVLVLRGEGELFTTLTTTEIVAVADDFVTKLPAIDTP